MRLKMIAGNVIVVLLIGIGGYWVVKRQIESGLTEQIDRRIPNEAELLSRSWRLAGTEFAGQVLDRAGSSPVRQALLGAVGEQQRRSRAFEAAQSISAWFQDPARGRTVRPDIVVVIDETGTVVARDTDRNRMFGKPLLNEVPAIKAVLDSGVPSYDVWARENKLLQIAVAAVRNTEGGILGALLVGYDLSNAFAKGEADVLGRDVVYLTDERIYSSSTSGPVREALQRFLYQPPLDATTQAALRGNAAPPWTAEIGGREYVGITARLPNVSSLQAGFAILADRTDATALSSTANVILMLTLLGLICVGVYGLIIANNLMEPLMEIEDDVLALINGRTNVRIEVESKEFGGLAYRINQLINLFMGVAEEDEEGRAVTSAGGWEAVNSNGGATPAPASTPAATSADDAKLGQEAEGAYYARLYQEYVAAKQAVGEDVSSIPKERFIERIEGNAAHLIKRHGARMVRFRVEREGQQVNLTPVIFK